MQTHPRLNNTTLTDHRYPTTTHNKRYGVSIQGAAQSIPQKTYHAADTPLPNSNTCWTPEQDAAWFLGAGVGRFEFESCQLGDESLTTTLTVLRTHGQVKYTIAAGGATRGAIDIDTGVDKIVGGGVVEPT
jgi:hypothetical protein